MKGFQTKKLHQLYQDQLLNDCIPFWLEHSLDRENGGYFTCLDRQGKVYSTDKPVWFQGRGLWIYSKLCNTLGARDEWLEAARLGYAFLNDHCFDTDGRMFFLLTADGRPLRKRRYMFSETFAAIACAEYAKATGDRAALEKARSVYDLVVSIYRDPATDPYAVPPKFNPAVRPMKAMAVPMILLNTNHVMREADGERAAFYDGLARVYINDILNNFFKPECKALLETVGARGERLDTPAGRVVNAGHAIEASWFLMHEALHFKDDIIMKKALDILLWSLELGWDKEYGGILYFTDIRKFQPEQLEWDMKLWWPHTEALYALLLAYAHTRDERFAAWYGKIHEYTFDRFPDRRYGEWFGYLHRDGSISHTLKGSVFKGPFHIPRTLLLCAELLKARQLDFQD